MAQSTKRFKWPRNEQEASRLIQLPSELRLKILRNVLKAEAPLPNTQLLMGIDGHDIRTADQIYADGVQLSAQSLSVCQRLFEEAFDILYSENVLPMCVTFMPGDLFGVDSFTVLNYGHKIRANYTKVLKYANRHFNDSLEDLLRSRAGLLMAMSSQYITVLEFCRKIELTLCTENCRILEAVCWQLKPLMENRVVVIKQSPLIFKGVLSGFGPSGPRQTATLEAVDFAACRIFRCRSLTIELRGTVDDAETVVLREIQKIAESESSVTDLVSDWNKLQTVREVHIEGYAGRATGDLTLCFSRLESAALKVDVDQFRVLESEVITIMRKVAAYKVQDLEAAVDHAKRTLVSLNSALDMY